MRFILPILMTLALPCAAQDVAPPMVCTGEAPNWSLRIAPSGQATFDYLYTVDLDFALETRAEGMDWPRAYTYVGRGSSAILVVEPADGQDTRLARVFTQRGETPILLVGRCDLRSN